jgi:transketolase C-terminal domain/subunit
VTRLLPGHVGACAIEDHATVGGLADEIGRIMLGYGQPIRFGPLGVGDYGQAGTSGILYRRYGLDVAGITAAVGAFASGVAMPAPPPSS